MTGSAGDDARGFDDGCGPAGMLRAMLPPARVGPVMRSRANWAMSPLGITLLMLTGFAGFAWLAWRKLAIVTRLQPEVRWDQPAARLKAVLVNGFLQQRMVARDWKPGLMHAVIFLGFMALLVRKLQLIAIGFDEPFVYPGLAGGLFAALKDVVELAVLAALAYAFYRRYVLRPRRLEHNPEALLVLVLITVIMVTDLMFDGFRFALLGRQRRRHRARERLRLRRQRAGRSFAGCRHRCCRPATSGQLLGADGARCSPSW
jgi:hypothetical protein